MPPKVSILITVYNRDAYLADAVESALQSSFQDFELIIVDDCSTDRSVEIAQAYAARDRRIRVYVNDENLGDFANRNRAASYANGTYLKYLDADDIIYPYSLQSMVEAMGRFPQAGLGLSYNVIDDNKPYPQCITPRQAYQSFFLGCNVLMVGPSAAIIRRDSFEQVGGFHPGDHIGDTALWLRLAAQFPVVKLQPALVWWRQHPEQQSILEKSRLNILNTRFQLKMETLEHCGELLRDDEKRRARKKLDRDHGRCLWSIALKQRRPWTALTLFRQCDLGGFGMLCSLFRPGRRTRFNGIVGK